MVDVDGTVREQRSYSPYGELLFVETFGKKTAGAASAGNPIVKPGHDGLFFDRFNASILAPPHAVGARGVYYNVNRSYSPHLGRFLQSDPNATGQALAKPRGRSLAPMHNTRTLLVDPTGLHQDGFNLYAAYGSNPVQFGDPEGLDKFGTAVGLFVPGPMDYVTGALQGLVSGYAANMGWDIEWAADMDMPDDMHTRLDDSWIPFAMLQGLYDAFDIGFGDWTVNPLDAIPGSPGYEAQLAKRTDGGGGGNSTRRPHGSPPHWGAITAMEATWRKVSGVSQLHMHRRLRGADGKILYGKNGAYLLPDLQFWWRGKLHVYEFKHLNPADLGEKQLKYIELLKDNGISPNLLVYRPMDV